MFAAIEWKSVSGCDGGRAWRGRKQRAGAYAGDNAGMGWHVEKVVVRGALFLGILCFCVWVVLVNRKMYYGGNGNVGLPQLS